MWNNIVVKCILGDILRNLTLVSLQTSVAIDIVGYSHLDSYCCTRATWRHENEDANDQSSKQLSRLITERHSFIIRASFSIQETPYYYFPFYLNLHYVYSLSSVVRTPVCIWTVIKTTFIFSLHSLWRKHWAFISGIFSFAISSVTDFVCHALLFICTEKKSGIKKSVYGTVVYSKKLFWAL